MINFSKPNFVLCMDCDLDTIRDVSFTGS